MDYKIDDQVIYTLEIEKPVKAILAIPCTICTVRKDSYDVDVKTSGGSFCFSFIKAQDLRPLE